MSETPLTGFFRVAAQLVHKPLDQEVVGLNLLSLALVCVL